MTLLAVVGPTASGKSDLAIALARDTDAEVLSTDSMQVYRGMDIGTAKPSVDVRAEVPHHLIDLCEPEATFTVAEFQARGNAVLEGLESSGRAAIIAGGSGLHLRALIDPLAFPPTDPEVRERLQALDTGELVRELLAADPAAAELVDMDNPRRVLRAVEVLRLTGATPSFRREGADAEMVRAYEGRREVLILGIDPGDRLADRAEHRLAGMLDEGFVEEVARLSDRLGPTAAQAVGYRQLLPYVRNEIGLDEAVDGAFRATLALTKRQRTFFRRDPRVHWLAWDDDPGAIHRAARNVIKDLVWSS